MTMHKVKKILFEKIYVCNNPLSRLRGIFFRGKFTDRHAVLLENCSSVHGFGIRQTLDVIFLTKDHQVLAIKSLKPFGVRSFRGAHSVLEIRSGLAEKLFIKVNDHLHLDENKVGSKIIEFSPIVKTFDRQRGASMVEFLIIAPVLVYLGVGIVQLGMAYHARNILDYATFEAARVGAVKQADVTEMRGELAYRLGPIFPGNGSSEGVRSAVTDAVIAVNDPLRTHIKIINPSSAAFEDFGVPDPETGETVLPSTHLQHRSTRIGNRSNVSIQDANLLKIEVTHGYELRLPWLDIKLPGADLVLKELMTIANPSNAQYYLRGQIPLRAVATVRMQSDALANNVEGAAEGVTRPETDELDSVDPADLVSDEPAEQIDEQCIGSNGLPSNLEISTISGEELGDVCLISPPESPVLDTPVQQSPVDDSMPPCPV